MPQTKKKRQTKHRGNAAGVVESRGRTGRPPSAAEKKKAQRTLTREERLSRKPSWKQSFQRAALAGVILFVFWYITYKGANHGDRLLSSLVIAVLAMALYIPLGYYFEMGLWKRRMAKKTTTK